MSHLLCVTRVALVGILLLGCAPEEDEEAPFGFVDYAYQSDAGGGPLMHRVLAHFERGIEEERGVRPWVTERERIGDCLFETPEDNTPRLSLDAGTITVTANGVERIAATEGTYSAFRFADALEPGLAAGDTVEIVASGATVAAFEGEVVLPEVVDVTPPAAYERGVDWTYAWAPREGDELVVVEIAPVLGVLSAITCRAEISQGELVVPVELLDRIYDGDVTITVSSARTVRVEGASVALAAQHRSADAIVVVTLR